MYLQVCLVHCLVMAVTVLTTTSTEIFTSTLKVERLIMEEEQLLTHLKQYIDLQYEELKSISQFHTDRMSNVITQPGLEPVFRRLCHPNSVYKVIKQFAMNYTHSLGSHFVNFYNKVAETGTHYLANMNDVEGASKSLLRLQSVYNLTALDMANGDYLGTRGPKLSHADAYRIGQTAFKANQFNQSLDWLNTSLALINASTELQDGPRESAIRGLLGRVFLYNGEKRRARAEYNKSRTIGPDNEDVTLLGSELKSPPLSVVPRPHDTFHNYSHLCSMEKKLVPADFNDPRIVCRYRQALLFYYRFKEEILSVAPFASVIYDVLSDEENDNLQDLVKDNLERAEVISGPNKGYVSGSRTGSVAWIFDSESRIASSVSRRIECITGLDLEQGLSRDDVSAEPYQIINYGLGGHYNVHIDMLEMSLHGFSDRIATFLIYLNDVEKGGSTVFTRFGVVVPPVKNMALLWYNYSPAYKPDALTAHAGCPVLIGQKWIANKWIWTHGNVFRRRCGLSPKATQLDIEPDMKKGYISSNMTE